MVVEEGGRLTTKGEKIEKRSEWADIRCSSLLVTFSEVK